MKLPLVFDRLNLSGISGAAFSSGILTFSAFSRLNLSGISGAAFDTITIGPSVSNAASTSVAFRALR